MPTRDASATPASDEPREIRSVVPDATALKALTHPVRLRMLGMLRLDGPATATSLAQRLDLNSGATSYHLRQLAQHGFIEEDAARGSKRDRWWRAAHESTQFLRGEEEGDELQAGLAFTQSALSWQVSQMQRAVQEYAELPPQWRRAVMFSDFTVPLTPEQAEEVKERFNEIVRDVMSQSPASGTPNPPGTEHFSFMLHGFPYPGRITPAEDES